jgi:hypothetical protein
MSSEQDSERKYGDAPMSQIGNFPRSGQAPATTAVLPDPDIQGEMSAFTLISSAVPPCVDGSHLARVDLTLMQGGRVLPCVRPVGAAHGRWP